MKKLISVALQLMSGASLLIGKNSFVSLTFRSIYVAILFSARPIRQSFLSVRLAVLLPRRRHFHSERSEAIRPQAVHQ